VKRLLMHGLTRTASNWSECRQATKLVTFNGVTYGIFVTGPIEAARQAAVVAGAGTFELPVLSSHFRLRGTKRTFGGQEGTKIPGTRPRVAGHVGLLKQLKTTDRRTVMPLVTVKVVEGVFTPVQ
jgi:hypothetical protein